jgi:DNA helicase-2/ATP-dependent DNA helicase PcrA
MYGRTQFNPVSRFVKELPERCVSLEGLSDSIQRVTSQPRQKSQSISKEFFSRPAVKTQSQTKIERFMPGQRVVHAAFGEGTVLSSREMGTDVMYEIVFDDCGTKKLMATYAKLQKI